MTDITLVNKGILLDSAISCIVKMKVTNPHALYINCDGAMDYGAKSHGGVGFVIRFPEALGIEDMPYSVGTYTGANIERMEIEALTQAFQKVLDLFTVYREDLKSISQIIFITDRFGLSDSERMSPYLINTWRQNRWKNFEGKPIKNHEQIDKLDKLRKKLSSLTYARINIEYRPRKQNKIADKLAKAGKKDGLLNTSLAKKSEKIGKRKFDGGEVIYRSLSEKQELHINIFRKDPVQELWEVWGEICCGERIGQKLKFYADDILAGKLHRGNEYVIRVKIVHRFFVEIFKATKSATKHCT